MGGPWGHPKPTRAGCASLTQVLVETSVRLIEATHGPLAIRDTLVSLNGTYFERGSATFESDFNDIVWKQRSSH